MANPDLRFPIVCFHGDTDFLSTAGDWDHLTTTNRLALKTGVFNNVLIVDSSGQGYRVSGARRVHGIGPFGGWNLFLNPTIRVELSFDGNSFEVPLDDVKERVHRDFAVHRDIWTSGGDFPETKAKVRDASSIREVIGYLHEILHKRY